MMRRDRLDIVALVDHRLHRAKLVERMEALAHGIFGETVVLGENIAVRRAHDAGDWRIIRETLPLHQQFERAIAPPPRPVFHSGPSPFPRRRVRAGR